MKILVKTLPFILTVLVFVSCNACSGDAQAKKAAETKSAESAQTSENSSDEGYSGAGGFGLTGAGGFSSTASGDSRNDIDAFFNTYEMLIVRTETASANNDLIALFSLETQHIDLTTRGEKLKQSPEWTQTDSSRLSSLNTKASKALGSQ